MGGLVGSAGVPPAVGTKWEKFRGVAPPLIRPLRGHLLPARGEKGTAVRLSRRPLRPSPSPYGRAEQRPPDQPERPEDHQPERAADRRASEGADDIAHFDAELLAPDRAPGVAGRQVDIAAVQPQRLEPEIAGVGDRGDGWRSSRTRTRIRGRRGRQQQVGIVHAIEAGQSRRHRVIVAEGGLQRAAAAEIPAVVRAGDVPAAAAIDIVHQRLRIVREGRRGGERREARRPDLDEPLGGIIEVFLNLRAAAGLLGDLRDEVGALGRRREAVFGEDRLRAVDDPLNERVGACGQRRLSWAKVSALNC